MKKTINVLFAFTFALSCFFTSCANLEDSFTSENGDNGGNPTYSISGTVTGLGFEGQEPRDNSRTAMSNLSDIEEENIKYTVKAQKGDLVVTKEGSPFTLALPSAGEWTVSATGVDRTNQSTVLSTDSKVIFISPVSPTGYVNLEARPVITDDGSGKINLSFGTLPLKVSRVSVVCNDDNWQDLIDSSKLTVNLSGIKTADDAKIKSGSYSVDINFYDSNGVLCYNCTQTINVFNGFTTNTWIKHGSESYLEYKTAGSQKPGSAADFELTDALLDQYVLRTIYVDTSFTGTSTGTWLAPYKTLDDARDFVSSKLSELGEITLMLRGTEKTVEGTTVYELNSYSENSALFTVGTGNTLTVKSWDITKPVTITNKEGNRGFFNSYGTLKLENIILDGTSIKNGDGSRFESGAIASSSTVELTNVTIRNFIVKPETAESTMGSGAALRITDGTVTLNRVKVFDCLAVKGTNMATGCGGAMSITGGTITLSNSSIHNCGATYGGAINLYGSSTLTLENVTISDCTANIASGGGGGAINVSGGSLKIKGKTVIENNRRSDNTLNNIELAPGININISGTGAESRIGITKDFDVVGENTIQFASDTTANISEKYFSDAGYTIANTSGKGCIARTTGVLGAGYYEDVKFAADETEFFVGEGTSTITFSAKVGAGTDPVAIDNWNATVTYAGIDITNRVEEETATEDKKSYKIVLPSTFPEGNYYIAVKGDYNGVTYSGNHIIKIITPTPVATYAELSAAIADAHIKAINLTADIVCENTIEISRKLTIFSTGNKSISCSTDYVFNANSGADLILKDITFGSGKAAVNVNSGASVTLDSGTIVSPNGDLVPIKSAGTLYIKEGAKIKDNTNAPSTKIGGAIYLTGGNCYMTGGEISNNKAYENSDSCSGGAIRIESATCYISGGKIYGNSSWRGCAIYMNPATLYISGNAEIYENSGVSDGAIYVKSGAKLYMSGGLIRNNTTGYRGGGVYVYSGQIYFTGGSIVDNIDQDNEISNDVYFSTYNVSGDKFDATGASNDAVIGYLYIKANPPFSFIPGTVNIQHFTSDNSNYQYP
ncbi:MAG: hypothetical protein MJ176_05575 [Treponema sp.]|nr:hypothetical protein [Treponema sp.]